METQISLSRSLISFGTRINKVPQKDKKSHDNKDFINIYFLIKVTERISVLVVPCTRKTIKIIRRRTVRPLNRSLVLRISEDRIVAGKYSFVTIRSPIRLLIPLILDYKRRINNCWKRKSRQCHAP